MTKPEYPDQDCPLCCGEGEDADPYGLFDGYHIKPCPACYHFKEEPYLKEEFEDD